MWEMMGHIWQAGLLLGIGAGGIALVRAAARGGSKR